MAGSYVYINSKERVYSSSKLLHKTVCFSVDLNRINNTMAGKLSIHQFQGMCSFQFKLSHKTVYNAKSIV